MSSGCVLYASPYIWYIHLIINKGVCAGCGGIVYISAWASALLVQTGLGNAKASMRGTGNRYGLPALFSYMYTIKLFMDSGRGVGRKVKMWKS